MMLIVAFVTAHLGLILGAITGAAGVIWGAFRHQQANAAISGAQATVASAKQAQAEAQAAAQAHAAQALTNADQAQADAAKVPDADLDSQLDQVGGLRK